MRNYELAYIARSDLDDEALTELEGKIQGWIDSAGGELVEVDRWGRRKLAYPVQEYREGVYYFVSVKLPGSGPAELEQNLKVTEPILRYLITRTEPA